jgi:hypothetical protein
MYFFRKNGDRVYVVHRVKGKLKALPRKETRHLDDLPDDQVQLAVQRLEAVYKARKPRPDTTPCPAPFEALVRQFEAFKLSQG